MAHSVAQHLRITIADYDRFIRTVIPGYDAMREAQLQLLTELLPVRGRVLDLGGGNGALAAAVAAKFPHVRVEIWDTDPDMLAAARVRCARYGRRISYVARSFAGTLPRCDAVVACIALHHVKDLGVKAKIYANIRRALRAGGIFANADCTMSAAPKIRAASFQGWADFMRGQGYTKLEICRHFAAWAKEDFYPPLANELKLMGDAGFTTPECFWKNGPFAVFGGVKR